MGRYKILDQHGLTFLTMKVVDWVDIFIRKSYKDIIIDSLKYCQKEKGLIICAYVIMSSHIHMAVKANDTLTLSDILRDFKKFTANTILDKIENGKSESRREWLLHRFAYRGATSSGNRKYRFWKLDNHPINLFTLPVIAQKVDYIHLNPVKEGWVELSSEYLYSSASNYETGNGILDVTVLDLPLSWEGYSSGT